MAVTVPTHKEKSVKSECVCVFVEVYTICPCDIPHRDVLDGNDDASCMVRGTLEGQLRRGDLQQFISHTMACAHVHRVLAPRLQPCRCRVELPNVGQMEIRRPKVERYVAFRSEEISFR